MIVRNMPGAGSLVAANSLYSSRPRTAPRSASSAAASCWSRCWAIRRRTTTAGASTGSAAGRATISSAWSGTRSRCRTLQDVTRRETVVGATGPGSRTLTYPKALNELLGTKFKIVSGYPGGNEITLALERGEVEGYCGWALGSIKTRAPEWIRDGKIRPLAQFTLAKADLPNVPLATDLAAHREGRQAIEFFAADSVLAWPLMAPPDVPAERVAELRAAFNAMMQDPQLLAEAAQQGLDIDPVSGAEIAALVGRLYATPPDVLELVGKINASR